MFNALGQLVRAVFTLVHAAEIAADSVKSLAEVGKTYSDSLKDEADYERKLKVIEMEKRLADLSK